MGHVALLMAPEAMAFLHELLAFFVCELLEWGLRLDGGCIDVHWDDPALVTGAWLCWVGDLAGFGMDWYHVLSACCRS